jgi:hypothetical protein
MEFGGERHTPTDLSLWKSSVTHCKGVWLGFRACLDGYGEEKISCSHRNSNTDRAFHSPQTDKRAAVKLVFQLHKFFDFAVPNKDSQHNHVKKKCRLREICLF